MGRFKITESIEIGNHITGEYGKWSKTAEFEGSTQEVLQMFNSASSKLLLPCARTRGVRLNSLLSGNIINLLKEDY